MTEKEIPYEDMEENIAKNIAELIVRALNEDEKIQRLLELNIKMVIYVSIPISEERIEIVCDRNGCRLVS